LDGILLMGDRQKEAEINSHHAGQVIYCWANAARVRASEQGGLLGPFQWFKWVVQTRLEAEWASYWIARGDTRQAATHAQAALDITRRSLVRKYMVW
jgi:hypothetical protein